MVQAPCVDQKSTIPTISRRVPRVQLIARYFPPIGGAGVTGRVALRAPPAGARLRAPRRPGPASSAAAGTRGRPELARPAAVGGRGPPRARVPSPGATGTRASSQRAHRARTAGCAGAVTRPDVGRVRARRARCSPRARPRDRARGLDVAAARRAAGGRPRGPGALDVMRPVPGTPGDRAPPARRRSGRCRRVAVVDGRARGRRGHRSGAPEPAARSSGHPVRVRPRRLSRRPDALQRRLRDRARAPAGLADALEGALVGGPPALVRARGRPSRPTRST